MLWRLCFHAGIRHLHDYGALVLLDARFADDPAARRGVAAWLRGAIEAASLRDCARDCAAHFAPNGAAAFVASEAGSVRSSPTATVPRIRDAVDGRAFFWFL